MIYKFEVFYTVKFSSGIETNLVKNIKLRDKLFDSEIFKASVLKRLQFICEFQITTLIKG
jgi:hypothetical protein